MSADPPLPSTLAPGLYVHVPFCARICPYCDFAVTRLGRGQDARFRRYREALHREMDRITAEPDPGPLRADTIYFGGGTPSLAPPGFFAEAAARLVECGLAAPSPTVILEANPEDLAADARLANRWVREGVSGVSLGAQALDDRRLRFFGRAHTAADVRTAVSRLAEAGTPWISLDLIYGAAGDTAEALEGELRAAAGLSGVTHLSAYELTIEPGTPFGRRSRAGERLTLRPPEAEALFPAVHETLADCGFPAYEASNFALGPEHRSPHNPKYWSGAPYLGLGPSAHSFAPKRPERRWNHRAVAHWQAAVEAGGLPTAGSEVLTPAERALEDLLLSLRTTEGLDLARFASRYGRPVVEANRALFDRWEEQGRVRAAQEGGTGGTVRLVPTLDGLAVADSLAREADLTQVEAGASE